MAGSPEQNHPPGIPGSPEASEVQPIESRANMLRRRYGEVLTNLGEIPLSDYTILPVQSPHDQPLENFDSLVEADTRRRGFGHRHFYWEQTYSYLARRVFERMVDEENDALRNIGMTETEQTPLQEIGLPVLERYLTAQGNYRVNPNTNPWVNLVSAYRNYQQRLPSFHEIGTLTMRTPQELLLYRNVGPKAVNKIEERLASLGLTLATPEPRVSRRR